MNVFRPPLATRSARANGLDTLRAAAIALVFMNHYMAFVSGTPTFGWASDIGWVGVDLFFVLSGYLIANQIFSGIVRDRPLSLKSFYARRALRTLPVFWFVLALYFLFPVSMGGNPPPPLWRFLTFAQNIGLQGGTAFSHAWSLCIEEQFYLVMPLIIVAGLRSGCTLKQGWALLSALLVFGVAARTILWLRYGGTHGGYYPNIYYATLCRFDQFLPGIAVAMLKNFHRPTWERVTRNGQRVLGAGVIATTIVLYLLEHFYRSADGGYPFFMTAFGYSLIAITFAILVVAALSPGSWLHGIRIPGAYSIALWSYSIYLSHKALAVSVNQYLLPFNLPSAVVTAIIAVVCVAAGALLYYAVETPFMAMRAKWFPDNSPREIRSGAQSVVVTQARR